MLITRQVVSGIDANWRAVADKSANTYVIEIAA